MISFNQYVCWDVDGIEINRSISMCVLPLSIISIAVVFIHFYLVSNYKHKVVNKVGVCNMEVGVDWLWDIADNIRDSVCVVWCDSRSKKAGEVECNELYNAESLQQ